MSMRVAKPGTGGDSGQSLVEFAIILPLLLLLMMGLFDAGRAVIYLTEVNNASRAGARAAMVNQSHDATCASADETYKCAAASVAASTGLTPASIPAATFSDEDGNTVNPTDAACQVYGSCSATVTANYTYTPITPIIGGLIGPIDLSASTTMAIERTYASP